MSEKQNPFLWSSVLSVWIHALPLCRKRKRTPGRMGRKRESWNNYARLFELLVMQEEVYPTSDALFQIWSISGNFRVPLVIAFRLFVPAKRFNKISLRCVTDGC